MSKCCNKVQHKVLGEYLQQKYQIISRIIKDIKIFFVCVYIYKMVNITRKTYEANDIEVITDEFAKLWLNERHVEKQ